MKPLNVRYGIRQHAFSIALFVAVAAILGSGFRAYNALSDLPRTHRRIVSVEEQLVRLGQLRTAMAATLPLRGGDELAFDRITQTITRGVQLIDELMTFEDLQQLKPLFLDCREHLADAGNLARETETVEFERQKRFRDRGRGLRSILKEQIAKKWQQIEKLQESVDQARQKSVWTLLGGNGLMLGVVGLLYFARRTEKRLRELADLRTLEADERFALIVRGSSDGIILADEAGRIQMTNPSVRAMFHADIGELEGQSVGALFATTLIDEWLSDRISDDDRNAILNRTVIARTKEEISFQAELTVTPRTIRNQEFLAISVRDVSEREISRLRLKQHEALLSEIPEPLHILDAVGIIVYWNHGAHRLFGFEACEAIGQSANDLLRIVPPKSELGNVHSTGYADAERWTGELQAMTNEGRSLRIERRRTRISEAGETIGEVILDLDLGERNRLQKLERRRQRLESLGTLASGIAHDLNNLLTPILMSSKMLQRDPPNIDRGAMLDTIVTGANRGADLISQLLTFARGGDGEHQTLPVEDFLPEIGAILRHGLPRHIELEIVIEPNLPEIVCDPTEISQVVMNLAINARDAMPTEGKLSIVASQLVLTTERTYAFTTLEPGNYLSIAVTDTGIGIPQNIRGHIFDPFFTTKERGQGTGLGLSTSIGIIRSHHGAVQVTSTVGKGTTIAVILPVSDHQSDHGENTV